LWDNLQVPCYALVLLAGVRAGVCTIFLKLNQTNIPS
jgi:hypothetical protein